MATQTAAVDTGSDDVGAERPAELQAPGYEIFIGLLAVLSLINLAISVLPFSEDTKSIAAIVNVPITAIFLADFTSRLLQSHPRRVYFFEQRGWLDLLGSLPAGFRLFRIFRLVRVDRLMKAYGLSNIIRASSRTEPTTPCSSSCSWSSSSSSSAAWRSSTSRARPPGRTSRPEATRCGGHS